MKKPAVALFSIAVCIFSAFALPIMQPISYIGAAFSAFFDPAQDARPIEDDKPPSWRVGPVAPAAVVFSDDFSTNTAATYTQTGQIGASAWTVNRSGADWGARRNVSPEQLELTNDASATLQSSGWGFAYVSNSSFSSPFSSTLNTNPGKVTWSFNMRQIRPDPAGFGAGSYGVAFILAGNTIDPDTGAGEEGYAVTLGRSGTIDPIRLVRFTQGLSTATTILESNTVGLTDFGAEYLSIRVTYNPADNQWELFLRNDGATVFVDPASGTLVSQGSIVDSTYVGQSLPTTGAYWQGATVATQTAFFDNVTVDVALPPNSPPDVPASTIGGPVGQTPYDFDVDTIYSDADSDTLASITNLLVLGGPAAGSSAAVLAGNIIRFTPGNPNIATTSANPYVVTYRVTDSAGSFTDTSLTIQVFDPPQVSTNAASNVSHNSAQLNGSATANVIASETTGFFRYGTVDASCNDSYGTRAPAFGGTVMPGGAGSFSETITGLSANTTYYFCALATNAGGLTVGPRLSFTTGSPPQYRSVQTGNWGDASTWEVSSDGGSNWSPATASPTSADDTITVRSGHVVTVLGSSSPTVDQLTVESGATLDVLSGQLTVNDGAGIDLVNNGALTVTFGTLAIEGQFVNDGTATITNIARLINDGTAGGSGTYTWGTFAQLHFDNVSAAYIVDGSATFWPATNGPQDIRVNGAGGIEMDVARSITTISIGAGVTGGENLTISDLTSINPGGSVIGSPTYGPGSSLAYNIGDAYDRGDEWLPGATSGAGVPNNVGIGGLTSLNLPNGTLNQEFLMLGDLNIGPDATLSMGAMTAALRVIGDVTLSGGNLELSSADLGDLYVGGDWNNSGNFFHNSRLVAFNGTGAQAINGSTDFAHLSITATTARTVTFQAGTAYLSIGTMTFTGAPGNLLTLRSSSPGTQWGLSAPIPAFQTVEYVNVQDSNASFGNIVTASNSVDSGNNLNWNFGAPPAPGTLSWTMANQSASEANNAQFTIQRTGGSDGTVSIDYSLTDSGATGGATCAAGVDYINTGGTIQFLNGETSKPVNVQVCNDSLYEGNESFNVILSNPTGGATLGSPSVSQYQIEDNDIPSVEFAATDYAKREGSTASVMITRIGATNSTALVNYSISGGTATAGTCGSAGADYVTPGGNVAFAIGETEKTVNIQLCTDTLVEDPDETIQLTIDSAVDAQIGSPSTTTLTILDGLQRSMWVFGDSLTPNPVSSASGRSTLIGQSQVASIDELYVSVYQSTPNVNGRLMYEDGDMAAMIALAHAGGQEVWAAYGDSDWPTLTAGCTGASFPELRMAEVVAFNASRPANERFDGVMLDVESDPDTEGEFQALLAHYECVRSQLPPGLKLGVAINAFWDDDVIDYPAAGLASKPASSHIIDLPLDRVVVMGYRDTAGASGGNGIIGLDEAEIAYADSIGKTGLIFAGLETKNLPGEDGVTFYEEGESSMSSEASLVAAFFSSNPGLGGFSIHNYQDAYLSGETGWASAPTAAPVFISGRVTASNGGSIRGAVVMVQGMDGEIRSVTTNTFGRYRVEGLTAGASYLVTVSARRYTFTNGTQLVSLEDNVSGLDFTASP